MVSIKLSGLAAATCLMLSLAPQAHANPPAAQAAAPTAQPAAAPARYAGWMGHLRLAKDVVLGMANRNAGVDPRGWAPQPAPRYEIKARYVDIPARTK